MIKKRERTSDNASGLWEDAPLELTRRSVFKCIYGDTGSGRTSLALTAPGPIALLHAGEKLEGVVQRVSKEKEIKMMNFGRVYLGGDEEIKKQAKEVENKFFKAFWDAYRWARTIVVDTDTELYQLSRLAEFGSLRPKSGRIERNYEGINARWMSLLNSQRAYDNVNLIMISQTEDEWIKKKGDRIGSKSGKTIRSGKREVPIKADVVVRTYSDLLGRSYSSVIEKPWWNGEMLGMELEGGDSNFGMIMSLITEMDEGEWL